jgi:hypothetical protein
VIVALSVLLGARVLAGADDSVSVWVLRTAMSEGAVVTPGDVTARSIRFSDSTDADRYLSSGAAIPAGTRLLRDVGAGELLPRGAVGRSATLSLVEVPLSVAAQSVPASLRTGSVVDVWVVPHSTGTTTGAATHSVLVFDDVRVVSAPRSETSLGPSATRQVVVGLDKGQEADLGAALARVATGTVILTRRGLSR